MRNRLFHIYKKIFEILQLTYVDQFFNSLNGSARSDEPTFLDFIGDLSHINIAHLLADKTVLLNPELIFPIIAKSNDSPNVLVICSVDTSIFNVYDGVSKVHYTIDAEQLINKIEPTVLILERSEITPVRWPKAGSYFYHKSGILVKSILGISLALICSLYLDLIILLLFLFYSSGVILCLSLKSHKSSNRTVHQLCQMTHAKLNCDATLHSRLSSIGGIDVVDLGMMYFMTMIIYIVFVVGQFASLSALLFYFAGSALLFVIVLLIYQSFFLKSFCPLCLFVSLVVIGSFLLLYNAVDSWEMDFLPLGLSMTLGAMLTYLIDRVFGLKVQKDVAQNKNIDILKNRQFFKSLINNSPKVGLSSKSSLIINHSESSIKLHIILLDSCSNCHIFLQSILELLYLNDQYSLCIQVISGSTNDSPRFIDWFKQIVGGLHRELTMSLTCTILNDDKEYEPFTLQELFKGNVDEHVLAESLSGYFLANSYPRVFLDNKMLPDIYTATQIKEHLVLFKYA